MSFKWNTWYGDWEGKNNEIELLVQNWSLVASDCMYSLDGALEAGLKL